MGKNQVASGQIVGVRGVGLFRPFCQGFPWLNPGGSGDTCSKNSFCTAIPSHVRKGDAKGRRLAKVAGPPTRDTRQILSCTEFRGCASVSSAPAVAQKRSPYLVYCLRVKTRTRRVWRSNLRQSNPEFVFDGFRPSPRSLGSLAMDSQTDLWRLPLSVSQSVSLSWLD